MNSRKSKGFINSMLLTAVLGDDPFVVICNMAAENQLLHYIEKVEEDKYKFYDHKSEKEITLSKDEVTNYAFG